MAGRRASLLTWVHALSLYDIIISLMNVIQYLSFIPLSVNCPAEASPYALTVPKIMCCHQLTSAPLRNARAFECFIYYNFSLLQQKTAFKLSRVWRQTRICSNKMIAIWGCWVVPYHFDLEQKKGENCTPGKTALIKRCGAGYHPTFYTP